MASRIPNSKTPNRRITIGPTPSSANKVNTHSSTMNDPTTERKVQRPPRGRMSMIPRVGRENAVPSSPATSNRRRSIAGAENTSTTTKDRRKSMLPPPPPSPSTAHPPPSPGGSVMATTAASRRRSIGVSPDRRQSLLPPPVKVDPRNMNDKAFQQKAIKRLLHFLEQAKYPFPVNQKVLSRPSSKDFNNIVTFLLRRVDPTFQTGSMKIEDEIFVCFKNMGYPFTISKTSLVAAGSPHTWPALLGALSWLVDQLMCNEAESTSDYLRSSNVFESLQELDQKTDRAFFQFLQENYKAFMREDQIAVAKVQGELVARFEADDRFLEDEFERVTDLNAAIAERMAARKQEVDSLSAYANKREAYVTDLEQFHDLIRQMNEHKASMHRKVDVRTKELADTNAKLDRMNHHITNLRRTVATQALSLNDVMKMESEMKGISEAMERLMEVKSQREKALREAGDAYAQHLNECEAEIRNYNSNVTELMQVPTIKKEFANLEATLHEDAVLETSSAILGLDMKVDVQLKANLAKKTLTALRDSTNMSYQDFLDRRERAKEESKHALSKKQIIERKDANCVDIIRDDGEMHKTKLEGRMRRVDEMHAKVASLRDPVALEEQMEAYERQVAELVALRAEHEEANIVRKKAVHMEIEEAIKLMAEHEHHCQRKIAELEQYAARKHAAVGDLSVPTNVNLSDD